MRLVRDASGGVKVEGRPAWPTKAKKIKVNQLPSQGEVEDRRHLLHGDEQLEPLLDRVFTALAREQTLSLADELKAPLALRGYTRLPNEADKLMERVAAELNGAQDNLIADRAETAIISRISEINTMLLELIDGCESPSGLWVLLNNLTYSVTFDLSGKAVREKTAAALAWQSKMQNNFGETGKKQSEDLLTLLD